MHWIEAIGVVGAVASIAGLYMASHPNLYGEFYEKAGKEAAGNDFLQYETSVLVEILGHTLYPPYAH